MTRNTRRLAIVAGALAELAIGACAHAATGRGDARACERYREEHPDFLGAFAVTAHKPAWIGHGQYEDDTREFACPALPGGEGLAAMRIEKVPAHRMRM